MPSKGKKSRQKSTKQRSKSLQTKKQDRENCPHCATGAETYGYLKRAYVYDVDLARKIVSDGREPVELERDDVAYCVDNSRIHKQHIDHVNTKYPGILGHLWGPGEDGTWEHGHVLIDGNHRAARCLRDGLPFRACLLSEDESEQILKRGAGRNGQVYDRMSKDD
jgi:hypothetical protein